MLTRRRADLPVVLVLVLLLLGVGSGTVLADPPPPGATVGCDSKLGCGVGAYDQGNAGGAAVKTDNTTDSVRDTGTSDAPADPGACMWKALPSQPAAGSALWAGNDPAAGTIEYTNCLTVAGVPQAPYRYVANAAPGAPAAPPPPTPEELAQQAYQQLPIPVPTMNFGPDSSRVAVKYWLYMWVTDPGTATATAAAGAVSVTAVARLSSVTWTMGEPVSPDALSSAAAPITCQGPGSDPGPSVDTTVDPAPGACAYMYKVRSTPERTGGSGTWPVTATANWTITWAANTGQVGMLAAPPRVSTTQVRVGAWSTVLVADGASGPGG